MPRAIFAFVACLSLLVGVTPAAQNPPAESTGDQLVAELSKHRLPLALENGALRGEGAEFLVREARASQFFLVGEDHGIAELPAFTSSLFKSVAPDGYKYLAIEVGPLAALHIARLATQKDALGAFADFNKRYPYSVAFYSWREEAAMLQSAVATSSVGANAVWGLDQEFILSPKLLLERLVAIAPSAKARAVATKYYDKVRGEYARMVETKKIAEIFLLTATRDDFETLRAAYRPKPGSEADRLIEELEVSREIYEKNGNGQGYASNAQRAELMKRHFMERYRDAARSGAPKVVFKFGLFHMMRGRTQTNVYDIGNLVSELAASNGSRSFHLVVLPGGGTQNAYRPFVGNDADKSAPIDLASYDFADIRPLLRAAGESGWAVLDLRPLRPLLHGRKSALGAVDRGLAELIWGYDAALIMPKVHAATLFE